ncbi:superoxide dismutase family protein [Hyunsoonleella sp. 2307UL5-6]|uniref:superoxide dismutase family protein n=1 Tax=Hyunsoonleella sp. 2307UL5-6 TaxID=3384768 RepID=UPI0039BC4337
MTRITILVLAITVSLTACKKKKEEVKVEDTTVEVEKNKKIKIALNSKSDTNTSGNVVFKQENGSVTMTAIISGLQAGEHAIHIHTTADCSSPDGKSAGGHWNPTSKPHGKWGNDTGYHKGDIGNFIADENGNGTISKTTDEWCIGCGDTTKDILGKAIIVHAGADDFTSQPSGAAGARVSCAGIIQ